MPEGMRLLGYYFFAMGLVTQLVLLFLQVRTFARTRHNSLALLAAGSGIGAIYLALCAWASMVSLPTIYQKPIAYAGALLWTVYAILGIWGAAWLFQTFQHTFVERRSNSSGA